MEWDKDVGLGGMDMLWKGMEKGVWKEVYKGYSEILGWVKLGVVERVIGSGEG